MTEERSERVKSGVEDEGTAEEEEGAEAEVGSAEDGVAKDFEDMMQRCFKSWLSTEDVSLGVLLFQLLSGFMADKNPGNKMHVRVCIY